MLAESKTVEFKREYTDEIRKTVAAFANTDGGDIYIGIEDDGSICGTKSPAYDRGINCLVIAKNPTFTGCMVEARPIATLRMSDDKGYDPKVICVAVRDPRLEHTMSLADLTEYILLEVHHFFEIYQTLERREVTIDGWADTERRL